MNEDQLHKVADAVKKYPHLFVGVIPFSKEITSEFPLIGVDYIPYGSTLLTNLASKLNWAGLHFDRTKLNYRNFIDHHPDMLNSNVLNICDAIDWLETVNPNIELFTRPSEDLKQYPGQVMRAGDIYNWFKDISKNFTLYIDSSNINSDTEVVLCNPKILLQSGVGLLWIERLFLVLCTAYIISPSIYMADYVCGT